MRIFEHTASEKGLWRGWLKNGQAVEISYGRRSWKFGAIVTVSGNDCAGGRRLLNLHFGLLSVWLPLGMTAYPWEPMDGPRWGASASRMFGLCFYWGQRRKSYDWPWNLHTLAYEALTKDGDWRDLDWQERQTQAHSQVFPYTYTLRSGKVQNRTATVTKRRHVLTWRAFRRVGWPRWTKESIHIEFDGEVGERSGTWRGGCIGCSYDLRPGESMEQALRRMEAERVFR